MSLRFVPRPCRTCFVGDANALFADAQSRVVLQKDFMDGKLLGKEVSYAATPKSWWIKESCPITSPFSTLWICPFLSIFIASNPLSVRRAVLNDLNPMPAFVSRFMARWSCSITLFKYFFCRSSVVSGSVSSTFNVSTAFGYAAFLSTVITRGDCVCVAFKPLRKNRSAALPSRLALSIKSNVLPALSTALYRYGSAKHVRISVKSM